MTRMNIACFALFALVIQNTSLVILLKLSFRAGAQPYDPTTVVLTVEVVKLFACSLVVWQQSTNGLVAAVEQIPTQRLLIVPSLLYVIQNNLLFFGAQRLSPIVYIVCTQMKILTTALFSRMLLGTELSASQQLALVLLVFGIVIVQGQGTEMHAAQQSEGSLLGVIAVLLASITSGLAGVVLEKVFKDPKGPNKSSATEMSVWTRNVQLGCVSLPFALAVALFHGTGKGVLFGGYDAVVALVIFLQAGGGIITGYVLKYANNILKCIAIALSICCCAAYSVANGELDLTASLALGVIVVNVAVVTFSLNSKRKAKPALTLANKPNVEEASGYPVASSHNVLQGNR